MDIVKSFLERIRLGGEPPSHHREQWHEVEPKQRYLCLKF